MHRNYPPEKIISVLKSSRLFNQFDEAQLIQLIAFARVEHFDEGAEIIEENSPNDTIYILLGGSVAIYVGDELILKLRRKGDIIGEMSVITQSLTTASVVAAAPVVLFAIPSRKIYDSGHLELRSLWFKLFSDILAQKLSMTNKKVIGFQAASAELDKKKQELIKKTMILQSVLGSMEDGVVVTDGKGTVLHANEAFKRMTGGVEIPVNVSEWPKKIGFYKPDGQTACKVRDLPMVKAEAGILVDSEEIYINNDHLKEGIWLQAAASLLKTDEGKQLEGAVVVFRNFTKKKLEKEALIKAKENALATAKAKSDFLSVMSHELRTPLNGIIGMSRVLNETALTPEQQECLDAIIRSGDALLAKIKTILYFNDLESGDVQIKKEKLVLSDILNKLLDTHGQAAREKGIAINTAVCKAAHNLFLGDREKILTAVDHLMDNAVKYSGSGSITLSADVKEQNDASVKFIIAIKDEGIGLSKETVQALFQPFFQADASFSRPFEGTGLGLAVTKRVVEMMGGSLEVDSSLGLGSCFSFTVILSRLKTAGDCEDAGPVSDIRSLINSGYAKRRPLTILVAEDNKVNQLLIKKILAGLGYQARIAQNGVEAVEACEREAFDLVLMDIQMPEMDGLAAAREILKNGSMKQAPKIVALTANTTEGIRDACLSAGMTDYISKPLDIETLVRVLESLPGKG